MPRVVLSWISPSGKMVFRVREYSLFTVSRERFEQYTSRRWRPGDNVPTSVSSHA
jgi:hypothetical protein